MDILLAADTQHINGILVRAATNRSAYAAATRPAAVALRTASGGSRKLSGFKRPSVKRLKRRSHASRSDAKRTGEAAGDAIATDDEKRFGSKRF